MTASSRSGLGWTSRRPRLAERDDSWFQHPEMQARIARAEADLREGRYVDVYSEEELLAFLNSLK